MQYLTEPVKIRQAFKCIKPIFPQANTAIFVKQPDSTFSFEGWNKDQQLPETDTGYTSTDVGDSGNPYWITSTIEEERNIVLAVHNGRHIDPPAGFYSSANWDECRMTATKVSLDVVNWVKQISHIT